MSMEDIILQDRPEFQLRNGDIRHFVSLHRNGTLMLAWTHPERHAGETKMSLCANKVEDVNEKTLTGLGLWEKISSERQQLVREFDLGVRQQVQAQEQENHSKMEHARAHKRQRYSEDIPRKLECGCGRETTMGPGLLLKKAEEEGVSWEDWVKNYKCMKCKSAAGELRRRGRQADPRYAGIPRKIPCSVKGCDKEIAVVPKNLLDLAEAQKTTWKEVVKHYKCRSCKAAAGELHVGRGRKADPKYEGLPRSMVCSVKGCKNETTIGPGMLLQKAEEAGLSWEEWIKTYKCRSCKSAAGELKRPRKKGRKKSAKAAEDGLVIPLKLKCCKCKAKKGTTPDSYRSQLERSGKTPEDFNKSYVCKSCRGK